LLLNLQTHSSDILATITLIVTIYIGWNTHKISKKSSERQKVITRIQILNQLNRDNQEILEVFIESRKIIKELLPKASKAVDEICHIGELKNTTYNKTSFRYIFIDLSRHASSGFKKLQKLETRNSGEINSNISLIEIEEDCKDFKEKKEIIEKHFKVDFYQLEKDMKPLLDDFLKSFNKGKSLSRNMLDKIETAEYFNEINQIKISESTDLHNAYKLSKNLFTLLSLYDFGTLLKLDESPAQNLINLTSILRIITDIREISREDANKSFP
jgi:hypothetical protein